MRESIFVGRADKAVTLDPRFANRHGLIAGATGTGKTVTLQILAEGFSRIGVPVFLADVKGDLSGLGERSEASGGLADRAREIGLDPYETRAFPTVFWDVFGERGHPVRVTVSEMGPLLLSRLMDLNEVQEGVLHAAFAVADDRGWLVLDLKDLRAILTHLGDHAKEFRATYGTIGANSVGAIQRRLLVLEREGAEAFFGEPALDIDDLIRRDETGLGHVNILAAETLIHKPRVYATFLFWLMSELFEALPEVGDPDKPVLILFFDEAHLLFDQAPRALLDKVEQVVRLIRSKGVGIFFISQNPADLPGDVLGQLGNRFQHGLRAFTAKDRRAVRAAADTFRDNPAFATADIITELGVGEALVSTLGEDGIPGVVQRTLIRPPASRLGPADAAGRAWTVRASPLAGRYDQAIDRESAYEILARRAEAAARDAAAASAERKTLRTTRNRRPSARQGYAEAMAKSTLRSVGRQIGRELVRGLMGSLFRGR